MTEKEILSFCLKEYGEILDRQGKFNSIRPSVLAGIMMRETLCGMSALLSVPGPEGIGDGGHGHGLFQIDDRWHAVYVNSGKWKDPEDAADYACRLLNSNLEFIRRAIALGDLEDCDWERAMIAAYNCGAGRVVSALKYGGDVDLHTAHGNYSYEVLRNARIYRALKKDGLPK